MSKITTWLGLEVQKFNLEVESQGFCRESGHDWREGQGGKKPLLQEVLLGLLAERSVQVLLSLIHRARIWD